MPECYDIPYLQKCAEPLWARRNCNLIDVSCMLCMACRLFLCI